jgi:hypothetical protein
VEQKLGRYVIKEQLGEGSFAWVYRGYDEELERHVALKVLKPVWLSDPQAVARFKQEARTMAKLHHPNIAVVYEVGEAEGRVFLAQFLVNGPTLSTRLKQEGPLTWPQMMNMLRPVASALDYAHQNGIIHRDIKPANILVDDNGQAYLGDFGLVRAAEGSVQLSASAGGMIGTPAYMAPEQWEDREVTPATDVYALSCVVVEMLTGTVLFDGSTPATVMKQHLMEGPRFPERWPEGVPDRVVAVLKRGLAEETADRISSAGELAAELEKAGAGEEVVAAAPPAAPERAEVLPATESPVETVAAPPEPSAAAATPPPAKKSGKPILAIIGAAVALLLIVCVAGIFLLGDEGSEPLDAPPAAVQVAEAEEAPIEPTELPAVAEEPAEEPPVEAAAESAPALPAGDISSESIMDTLGLEGDILFEERFEDNQWDWFTGLNEDEYDLVQVDLVDGHYRATLESTDGVVWAETVPGETFDDFVASVDALPLEYEGEIAYGLIFREQLNGSYYVHQINPSDKGELFSVWLWDNQNSEWIILVDFTPMEMINPDGPNQLAVKAVGPELSFYINGEEAVTIEDDAIRQGTVGLYFETYEGGGRATVDFDNLLVYGLNGP